MWDTEVTNQWAGRASPANSNFHFCTSLKPDCGTGLYWVTAGRISSCDLMRCSTVSQSQPSPQTSNKKNIPDCSASLYQQKTRDIFSLTLLNIRRYFSEIKWKTSLPASLLLGPVSATARKKEATEERF